MNLKDKRDLLGTDQLKMLGGKLMAKMAYDQAMSSTLFLVWQPSKFLSRELVADQC